MKPRVVDDITDLIGNTPIKRLKSIKTSKGTLWAKCEHLNPGGSMKDRAALQAIRDAYESGALKAGQPVVEMTSGNMGAGLAVVCAAMGNPFTAVMPEGNSPERRKMLRALGATVHLVKSVDGTAGSGKVTGADVEAAEREAERLVEETGAFYVDQWNNPSCPKGHYLTTGPEIWEAMEGKVDAVVSATGSSATIMGTSKYLKEKNPEILAITVEPETAQFIKTGKVDDPKHIIQGTGYCRIPPHWDETLCDHIIPVGDAECREMAQHLSKVEGLYVGYSAAANVVAGKKFLEQADKDLNVVVILCDTAFKYSDL